MYDNFRIIHPRRQHTFLIADDEVGEENKRCSHNEIARVLRETRGYLMIHLMLLSSSFMASISPLYVRTRDDGEKAD